MPPGTEATIFRAMKRLPDVTLVDDAADVAGRPAIAFGRTTEGGVKCGGRLRLRYAA